MGLSGPRVPVVRVDGKDLPADLIDDLIELEVRTSVREAGRDSVRFVDDGYQRFDKGTFSVGDGLDILFPTASSSLLSVFSGPLTTVGVHQDARGEGGATQPRLELAALESSHRLAAAATFKAYLDQTRKQVVEEIARRHKLTPKAENAGPAEPYLLQAGTDHAFLTELARGVGFEWFVHDDELHFRARSGKPAATLKRSDNSLLRFSASYSGVHVPKDVTVYGWDPQQQKPFKGDAGSTVATPGLDELGSDAPFVAEQYKNAAKTAQPLSIGAPATRDAKEAERVAAAIGLDLVSGGLAAEGVASIDPAIRAGGVVTVQEVGKKLSGKYYVTEVVHSYASGHLPTTVFTTGGHGNEPPRLSTATGGPDTWGRSGFVLGVVTNVNDPEKLGRVKVQYPSLGPDAESDWARVVTPGAGDGRGSDSRPEVNDEVVVGFERGDLRFPLVFGGVWSAKFKPPHDDTSKDGLQTRRELVSRVGHVLAMSDGPSGASAGDAKRYVAIELADGQTVVHVGEDEVLLEAKKGNALTLRSGDAKLVLTGSGDVEISGNNVSVDAKQAVKVKGGTDVKINAGVNLKMEGKVKVEAGGAQAALIGKAMATVKGGMVKIN